jgi:hypothetical protein
MYVCSHTEYLRTYLSKKVKERAKYLFSVQSLTYVGMYVDVNVSTHRGERREEYSPSGPN